MSALKTTAKIFHVFAVLVLGASLAALSGTALLKIHQYKQSDTVQEWTAKISDNRTADIPESAKQAVASIRLFTFFAIATLVTGGVEVLCGMATVLVWFCDLLVWFFDGGKSLTGRCCYKVFDRIIACALALTAAFNILLLISTPPVQEILKLDPVSESRKELNELYDGWTVVMFLQVFYLLVVAFAKLVCGSYGEGKVETTA